MTGNNAIALAARDSGVALGVGYPGTPSTEILEILSTLDGGKAEWGSNEKTSLEIGIGVSFGGQRSLVTMKHVGLNVCADPLFTVSYTGVKGGLVIMVADDPGMHSSQNEQDSRHYARAAKITMLEPASSQEAYDYTLKAFELSELFDTPIFLRTTTRVSHGKSEVVTDGTPQNNCVTCRPDNKQKYVMVPAFAKGRHVAVETRQQAIKEYIEKDDFFTKIEMNDTSVGIITNGVSYNYVKEVMPSASVLKLGMTYPLPIEKIRSFAEKVNSLYVVEELDPVIEADLKSAGINVIGKEKFPICGEFNPDVVAKGLGLPYLETPKDEFPQRPPSLCAGCPHRSVFTVLKKLGLTVSGDIGCYTLGVMPPLQAIDLCVCMGASVGMAHGLLKAGVEKDKVVAVIGDSTFIHSGITGVIDMVYNNVPSTLMILDNSITAMTGRQENPSTGRDINHNPTVAVDLEALVKAIGVKDVKIVDAYNIKEVEEKLKDSLAFDGPSVIIAKRPCMLIPHKDGVVLEVTEKCIACGNCLKVGCPAIYKVKGEKKGKEVMLPVIDRLTCRGCGLCAQVCPVNAITAVGKG